MTDVTAQGGTVSDLPGTQQGGGLGEKLQTTRQSWMIVEHLHGHARADVQKVFPVGLDPAEARNALDADDVGRISNPLLQFHEQVSATGEEGCLVAIPVQESDRIPYAFRFVVGKIPHLDNLLVNRQPVTM